MSDPAPQATEEEIRRAEATTPLHHVVTQEAMIVDVIPIVEPVYEALETTYGRNGWLRIVSRINLMIINYNRILNKAIF
jgi:phage gp29-like protein